MPVDLTYCVGHLAIVLPTPSANMPRKYYTTGLTHDEILEAFEEGRYSANLETGEVFGANGKRLRLGRHGRQCERYCVALFYKGKTIHIPRAKLIWIVGTHSEVPAGFQIDHDNEDPTDDRFDNLICLHKIDHGKRARQRHGVTEEPVPF